MIYSKKELRMVIGGVDPIQYLKAKGLDFTVIGKDTAQIFYIKNKLDFKSVCEIENVLKVEYRLSNIDVIDKTIKLVKELYNGDKYMNIEEAVIKDRDLVNLLVEEDILTVTEYNNYKVGVSYKFLAKILDI